MKLCRYCGSDMSFDSHSSKKEGKKIILEGFYICKEKTCHANCKEFSEKGTGKVLMEEWWSEEGGFETIYPK